MADVGATSNAFQVFDAHVHVGRWRTPDFAGRASDLSDVVRVLQAARITGALVMPTDEGDNAGLLRALAEYRARAGSGPELYFAAWIRPADAGLEEFLDQNVSQIHAFKIHPSFNRLPISDPAYRRYLQRASRDRLPVVVHCGRWQEVAGYEIALRVAADHPDVPFVLSHMGGDSAALVLGAARAIRERGLVNAFLGTESIREYWLVERALDLVGPERVVFGSDHNLNHPASFLAVIDAIALPPQDRARVLGQNARGLLASAKTASC